MKEKKLQELHLSFYKIFSAFFRFETVSISKIVPMSVFTVIISVLLIRDFAPKSPFKPSNILKYFLGSITGFPT